MDRDPGLTAQLVPFEVAQMAAAQAYATEHLAYARTTAEARIAGGVADARALLDRATAEGRRAAERAAAHRLVDARRRARRLVLAAQKAAYQRLIDDAVAAAEALRTRPGYAALERRLIDTARVLLGDDAAISENPDGHGGVRATQGGRAVDLTLPTLARRCVSRLGQELTGLWA